MTFRQYTTPAYGTRILILVIDIFLAFLSILLAVFLRFNFVLEEVAIIVKSILLVYLLLKLLSFRLFRTYAVIVRYAGLHDVKKVLYSLLFCGFIFFTMSLISRSFEIFTNPFGYFFPISIIIIDFFLSVCFIGGFRLLMPFVFNLVFNDRKEKKNVIIFGAGQLGSLTLDMLSKEPSYSILGIIDDNPDLKRKFLNGIPVYSPEDIIELNVVEPIESAIIAIRNISTKRKNEFVEICFDSNIKVLQIPINPNWSDDGFDLKDLKKIKIEDLLDRPSIKLENKEVNKAINNKVVLITGAAGSIGSELVKQVIGLRPKLLILVDQAETPLVNLDLECKEKLGFYELKSIIADVADIVRISGIFEEYKPNIVFHAAAYKHVPMMESFPREAINVNVNGTRIVANCAHAFRIDKFVMVSSDKAVNPTNVMGASKRIAELFIQSLNRVSHTQFITTRFGNVLGSNGSVIPRFKMQIKTGGPVTVTHPDITRYFMTISEAAQLIMEAGAIGVGGEIFLFHMGEPVGILQMAQKMIKLYGLTPYKDIDIKITGLRPGEKIKEELLTTDENSIKTHHPKIMKAKVRENDFSEVDKKIHDLISSIDSVGDKELVKQIKIIVPEYISNNSRFSSLDVGI